MKYHWRQFRMSSAIAVIAACTTISSMIVATSSEKIKTSGIETLRFKFPKLVSRFDLDDVNPDVASKIEVGASRIVKEVSSKATAVSKALKSLPTEVSVGMDGVCWGASPNECTPIMKGIDNWFSGPLEQFIKIKEYPWALDIIKLNILREGTKFATLFFFIALLGWLVSTLCCGSTYHSATTDKALREGQLKQVSREREEKELSREAEEKELSREAEEKELSTERKKFISRFVTIMVALASCVIMLLLLLNLMVVIGIDKVLAGVPRAIQRVPGNLRDLFIVSFVFDIVFFVCFCVSRIA